MQFHRYLALPAVVLLFAGSAPSLRADSSADARKAIAAAYAKMNAAAAKKDADGIFALHTEDYTETDVKGKKHTIAELKQQLPQIFRLAKSIKANTVIDSFSLKGSKAVVVNHDHSQIVLQNPQNPEQTATLVVDSKSEDTWVKGPKGWQQKLSKSLSAHQTLNGKEMKQP